MEKKNMVFLSVIAVATLLTAVVGTTFSFFTATADPDEENAPTNSTVTTATLGVTYAQQGEVNLQNIVPGELTGNEFIFSVTNSSQVSTAYTLVWDVETVDFAGQPSAKDLKYEILKCNDDQICKDTTSLQAATALPTETGEVEIPSAQAETVDALDTNYYKVIISFEDTGVAQNDMQGKNFAGLIKVGAAAQDVSSLSK